MEMTSSTKTEDRAINALKSIIDNHPTMKYQFNDNDKEMCWDGYIWLFKENNRGQSKDNLEGRVPVQIKGHNDPKNKYIGKNQITYSVDLLDLKAYGTEKGVIYFLIFVYEEHREIFYTSLFPSKIADYLDRAAQNGNKRSITIPFRKMKKDADNLYSIAKQFNSEATKQGSAYTPLVKDRIKVDDFNKLKSVNFTVANSLNSYENLLHLSTGDICLYGKTDGDRYFRPIERSYEMDFVVEKDVYQPISVGGEVFFEKYRCIADSNGGMNLILSPNLKLCITDSKFYIKFVSTLKELYRDARFLLKLQEADAYYIADCKFEYSNQTLTEHLEESLHFIIDMYETITMIGLEISEPFSQLTEEQIRQIIRLINVRFGSYNSNLSEGLNKYLWRFGEKYVPLLVEKENNIIALSSLIYSDKHLIGLPYEENGLQKSYCLPLFAYQGVDVLSNLYYYDYDAFQKQIEDSDVNEKTVSELTQCVLTMIGVFDINSDSKFLDLAEYLLHKLEPVQDKELTLLNQFQIKKRRGTLNNSDIECLRHIDIPEIHIQFGRNVLLGNKDAATYYFQQFPKHEQEDYKKYPIYKLYLEA